MNRIVAFMVCLALSTTANADLVDISEIAWTAGDTSVSTSSSGGVSVDFNFSGTLPLAAQQRRFLQSRVSCMRGVKARSQPGGRGGGPGRQGEQAAGLDDAAHDV